MRKLVYALLCMSLASCGGGSGSTPSNGGDTPPNPNPDTPTLKSGYVLSGDFGAITTEPLATTNKSLTATEFRPINFGNAPIGLEGFTYGNQVFVSIMPESYPSWDITTVETKVISSYSHDGVNWYKSSANLGNCQQSRMKTTCNTELFFDPQNKQFIAANFKSRDGITWEAFNNQGIVPSSYKNNIYLALNEGYLYRSNNAETWTKIDGLPSGGNLIDTGESFIYQQDIKDTPIREYYISSNGISWEKHVPPIVVNTKYVDFGCGIGGTNGVFTCSFYSGQEELKPYESSISTSLDGVNWTPKKLILDPNIARINIQSSKYLNNQYLADCTVKNDNYFYLCTSQDGISWSPLAKVPNVGQGWNNISQTNSSNISRSHAEDTYYLIGVNGNYYYRSPAPESSIQLIKSNDLVNWKPTLTGIGINNYSFVNNKQFATLSCPNSGDRAVCPTLWNLYSIINYLSPSLEWTPTSTSPFVDDVGYEQNTMTYANAIASNGKKYVAASIGELFYSDDGDNWHSYNLQKRNEYVFNTVKFINNQFIAVTNQGTVYRSSDGTTWDVQTISGKPLLTDIIYNNGTYILVGTKGYLARSNTSNKDSWDVVNTHSSDDIMSIVSNGNNTLVAVGEDGLILTSTNNGVSFTKDVKIKNPITGKTQVVSENINAILYNGLDGFIAVGNNGIILTSKDGINWNYYVNNPTQNYLNISPAK